MTIYIAMLRSINVSGHNKIKMAELRNTLETMGLSRVQTYIQSGNVLFESEEGPEPLKLRMEEVIRTAFGISTTVILRDIEELDRIIADCPYPDASLAEPKSVHVAVLTESPSKKAVAVLSSSDRGSDEYDIHEREIYFLFRQSILDSKLAKSLQKLGDTATMRNWNTITKLASLARAMQAR